MELQFLGTGAGQPSKKRNVSSIALKMLDEINEIWLFDVGEATQHQILRTNIRLRKVTKIFISHNHGDHIFGLPGLLATRSFQGDVGPITIYGPAGLEEFVRTALKVSRTKISYPIKFVVLEEGGLIFQGNGFRVYAEKLAHRVPSFGYRVVEDNRPGELLMDKLAQYNVPNGPLLGKLKNGEKITLDNGTILDGKDFLGPNKAGRVVTIVYDTRATPTIAQLAQNADVLVHESTFAGNEANLAHSYYHSTAVEAAKIARDNGVKRLFLNHISARYLGAKAKKLENQAQKIFPNTRLANDFDRIVIPMKGEKNE
ncbi:MAG: ribonuclease Z [Lactobacillus helsingborgensis]|uniref:ribonuclease Z n=1 Tax=Lactobacillus helsingborgensis TaxID=1218494 RepID=UPI00164FC3DD|nr:ribonuclease Z [Lactobacillus helsingborgensis]MBC6356147.1 ribonuclease Z [Lactobacillus helsingborgensis]MCT6812018.1 ribonuclease Z [Lactobacillus helsingborgensis]UZX32278.1 ribonuclease Z [Lactobacillus helsingborgensis]